MLSRKAWLGQGLDQQGNMSDVRVHRLTADQATSANNGADSRNSASSTDTDTDTDEDINNASSSSSSSGSSNTDADRDLRQPLLGESAHV